MSGEDIRWEQRFSNFNKALDKLSQAIDFVKYESDGQNPDMENGEILDEIVREGVIQRFEYTWELAWNVMKDYSIFQGELSVTGSRDAIKFAFQAGLIRNGDLWMEMIKSRQKTSHTYNEETAQDIYLKIINEYYDAFIQFRGNMEQKRSGEQQTIF